MAKSPIPSPSPDEFFNQLSKETIHKMLLELKSKKQLSEPMFGMKLRLSKYISEKYPAPKVFFKSTITKRFASQLNAIGFAADKVITIHRSKIFIPKLKEDLRDDQDYVSELADADYQKKGKLITGLDPIVINQDNKLIDGYVRLKAIETCYPELFNDYEVHAVVQHTETEEDYINAIYKANSKHNRSYSDKKLSNHVREKVKECKTLYEKQNKLKELRKVVYRSRTTLDDWTKTDRTKARAERDEDIYNQSQIGITQKELARKHNLRQPQISKIIEKENEKLKIKSRKSKSKLPQYLFRTNYWNFNTKGTGHKKEKGAFGKTPEIYLQNLIHYHTEPNDYIVDPFGGYATTIKATKHFGDRLCIVSDRKKTGRKEGIRHWNAKDGLHPDALNLDKIKLLYLDPPYWRQAAGEYAPDPNDPLDLTTCSYDEFNGFFKKFFNHIINETIVEKIAIFINPTVYDKTIKKIIYADHNIDFHHMIANDFKVIARYHCWASGAAKPYEKDFLEKKKVKLDIRDLWVYKRK